MIEARTVFSQVEVTEAGVVQVRLLKQLVDGDKILAQEYHRTALDPGQDLDAQMAAVNAHLARMGYPPADAEAVERVGRIVAVVHTPERVEKFKADRDKSTLQG